MGAASAWYPLDMLGSIRAERDFRPSRAKGQSFLRDRAVVRRIVSHIDVRPEDELLEIGAGAGELTRSLAAAAPKRILAVEPEPVLAARLKKALGPDALASVEVIEKDFLSLDLPGLLRERGIHRIRVLGNLPYSAASPMLLSLLSHREWLRDLTLMFQLEVAERLVARPSTKAYGFLSVVVQQAARPEILFQIRPEAFRPRPKVTSALVRLELRLGRDLSPSDRAIFAALVKSLFAHRRKSISNNIKRLSTPLLDEAAIREGLAYLAIDPSRRAETLAVEEFTALAHFCASPR